MRNSGSTMVPRRKFGRTGLDVSTLSIGAMRLPAMDEAVTLLRRAIDLGCNYIDTSRGYGDSELKLAEALKDGYRKKVILSTKNSPWIMVREGYDASADSTRRMMDEQMKRLQVDHLDFYQVWNITDADTCARAMAKGGMVDGIRQAIREGLVDHIGTTTHAPEDVVLQMINSGVFETITVTYHLLDTARKNVLERAQEKNVGIVVMNPMAGGILGYESPVIENQLPEAKRDSRNIALRFVLDNPCVSTAISGFTRISEVEENVRIACGPALTSDQLRELGMKVEELKFASRDFCTQCGYCMPCEQGVDIKGIFNVYNYVRLFSLKQWGKETYARFKPETKADKCTRCGKCVAKCTNKISIPDRLAEAHRELS